jgi:hypothetical protein
LRGDAGVNGDLKTLAAERTLDALEDFHKSFQAGWS